MNRTFTMSSRDAASLFGSLDGPKGKPAGRWGARVAGPKKRKQDLPENQVESRILDFLRLRGWIVERQQAGTVVGVGMIMGALKKGPITSIESLYGLMSKWGQKGRADWVAVRPLVYVDPETARRLPGACQRIEIEVKAEGKRPSPEQRKYLEDRAACGFLCGWFDALEDDGFGSETSFLNWYRLRFGE